MRKALLLSLIAAMPLCASAQWSDVTKQMLQNPSFDDNTSAGWDISTSGACNINYEAMENFNGWFDFSQSMDAPAGRYRLSCQSYYRMGDNNIAYPAHLNGSEEILAVLYANGNSTPVCSVYDAYEEGEISWWDGNGWVGYDGKKFPNGMDKGSYMFDKMDAYHVSLEFEHEGGDLQMGIKNLTEDGRYYGADWCMMDNFQLEYYGKLPDIPVELFYCPISELSLMPGDTYTLQTVIYPTNAAGRDITWKSSNNKVAKVSKQGVVTAVANGTATITGTCSGHSVTIEVTVEGYDENGKEWIDVTSEYLRNVNMEDGFDAWNREPARVDFTIAEFWNTTFDFYQEVELPEGYYRFSCEGFFRPTSGPQEAYNNRETNTHHTYIYGGTREVPMLDITSELFTENLTGNMTQIYDYDTWEAYYLPNSMDAALWCFQNGYYHYSSVVFHAPGGEPVKMGLYCNDYINGHWAIFDNFRLEKLDELIPTTAVTISGSNKPMLVGETRQLTAAIEPSDASYQTVIWSSSDPEVAEVDENGLVTANDLGQAIITATARDNEDIYADFLIEVEDSDPSGGQLVINEVMSMNVDQILDPSFNYGGWIELYNPTDQGISLRDCHVTEDPNNMTQYNLVNAGVVPAKGFYTIWFDHCDPYYPTQVDCKLSTSGDWIAVTSPTGAILAEIQYPAGIQRCSWARKVDGGDEWGWTGEPTPNATNATSHWATKQLDAPTVDVQGHLFNGTVNVQATWPKGATLRYTTDGSAPTATNGATSEDGSFVITRTTNLRLMAVQDGMLPSAVTTNTYIQKRYDFTIPVLSVTANNEDIYGNDHGIFVRGRNNGRSGNGQSSKCNWNQDWDHPCVFEYYDPSSGERTFMQDVDICAAGGWSRAWEPHSFKLKAAKKYGLNSMDYPFFESKPYNKHKALQIRNGGNDNSCRFKDAAIQTIIQRSGIYVDGQAYQPVVHYINGSFKGVINMREPNNKHHAYSNYGYDTDLLDQFEISPDSGYVQKAGTIESLMEWYDLAQDAADPDTYQRIIDEYVDVDEYINYMALWTWLANSDWMRNNVKGYRSQETGGKFHFVMFDTDGSFGGSVFNNIERMGTQKWSGDAIYELGGQRLYFELYPATIWVNMLQNDQFRKQFVDSYSLVCGSVFEPTRCNAIADELYNRVQPMMQLNGGSATSTYNEIKNNMGNSRRNTSMLNSLRSYYKFNDETSDPISNFSFSSNIPEGTILYNGLDVPTGKFTAGTAFRPVVLTAQAPGGYEFKGWVLKGASNTTSTPVFDDDEEWSYYDNGSLDGEEWMSPDYDDAAWSLGQSPLGYDDGSSANGVGSLLNTTISYGDNSRSKHPTYYFRKVFTLDQEPKDDDQYIVSYTIDDGCIIYINGQEVKRDNMPDGEVTFSTFANTYAYNNPNRGGFTIPNAMLHKGENLIAVEIHNNNASSSDICWGASLSFVEQDDTMDGAIISTDAELDLDALSDGDEVVAYFEKVDGGMGDLARTNPVRINEVSAMNETYANEYFKRNDWIELYNTTDEEIDVAGYYLSDNLKKPTKFQIPTQLETGVSTVIPAHGHMIIWCDKLNCKSQLHASFKLDGDTDACVLLTAPDGSWTDYLNYPAHDRNHSAGRYPDGADNAYLMTTMTPGKPNCMSTYTEGYELLAMPELDLTDVEEAIQPTLALRYDGQNLVCTEEARIEVYTTGGELLMSVPAARTVGLGALRGSIYVARAKHGNDTVVLKFRR